ncbi:hypothetical protein ATANTOWER_011519 [Ataeniobius toweri]|uniref:Uncharacterized protein n=1 Tax=Ataeniobius toweri TaxID=208326 RepID=A0ABU7B1T7_9TELE|nr:hypothetical protein [Ataeniobius toweri]
MENCCIFKPGLISRVHKHKIFPYLALMFTVNLMLSGNTPQDQPTECLYKTKYNCPVSVHLLPVTCWIIFVPVRSPIAANGGISWWCMQSGSPVRLHHVATVLTQTLHPAAKSCTCVGLSRVRRPDRATPATITAFQTK